MAEDKQPPVDCCNLIYVPGIQLKDRQPGPKIKLIVPRYRLLVATQRSANNKKHKK